MQKLVKKNSEKKLSKSLFLSKDKKVVKLNLKKKLKLTKFNKFKEKKLKALKFNKRILANLVSGRPFRKYQMEEDTGFLRLNVNITPNNVFCNLKDTQKNLMLSNISAGSYKLNVSKKGVRHYSRQIVISFLKDLRAKNIVFDKQLVTKITAPVNLRKPILDIFKNSLFKKSASRQKLIIDIPSKKVFNGCRPSKKIRKKRQGMRLFK
jgi:hypothetical protein